jgi:ketosteroid isomerase-like protein
MGTHETMTESEYQDRMEAIAAKTASNNQPSLYKHPQGVAISSTAILDRGHKLAERLGLTGLTGDDRIVREYFTSQHDQRRCDYHHISGPLAKRLTHDVAPCFPDAAAVYQSDRPLVTTIMPKPDNGVRGYYRQYVDRPQYEPVTSSSLIYDDLEPGEAMLDTNGEPSIDQTGKLTIDGHRVKFNQAMLKQDDGTVITVYVQGHPRADDDTRYVTSKAKLTIVNDYGDDIEYHGPVYQALSKTTIEAQASEIAVVNTGNTAFNLDRLTHEYTHSLVEGNTTLTDRAVSMFNDLKEHDGFPRLVEDHPEYMEESPDEFIAEASSMLFHPYGERTLHKQDERSLKLRDWTLGYWDAVQHG